MARDAARAYIDKTSMMFEIIDQEEKKYKKQFPDGDWDAYDEMTIIFTTAYECGINDYIKTLNK